jgi:hypothetical protein
MNQMYHYATVSKALDELNENGFTYDFNLHEQDIAKPAKYEIKHIYRYEGNTDPGDEAVVYGINPNQEKGSSSQVLNSISDAAQVLINISIKNRIK